VFEPDGEIDYSNSSTSQLEEAVGNIDKDQYPRNYQNLLAELEKRPPSPEMQQPAEPPAGGAWSAASGWPLNFTVRGRHGDLSATSDDGRFHRRSGRGLSGVERWLNFCARSPPGRLFILRQQLLPD
jgi:hypothetical protein